MLRTLTFMFMVLGAAAAGWACNVPVFRFALEQWPADKYVIVVHGGDKSLLDNLERDTAKANLEIIKEENGNGEVEIKFPASAEKGEEPVTAWQGKLAKGTLDGLADSPRRREIAKRLLAGDSVVWVVLESGDKTRDDNAAELVATEIARSAEEEKLREDRVGPPAIQLSLKVPVKVAYSVVRVSRTDEAERWFVRLLLGLYPDLKNSKEPVVFPVFGRGRVLGAAAGEEIRRSAIARGCEFLAGDCACEIKEQNPGKDLLMAVDWEKELGPRAVIEKPWPELTAVSIAPATAPATTTPATSAPRMVVKTTTVEQTIPLWQIVISVLAGLVVAVAVVSALILLKRKREGGA